MADDHVCDEQENQPATSELLWANPPGHEPSVHDDDDAGDETADKQNRARERNADIRQSLRSSLDLSSLSAG